MREHFDTLIQTVTRQIAGRPLDDALQAWLNAGYGAHSVWFREISEACIQAVEDGWMCQHEAAGLRYGRVTKPSDASNGFSVDVVSMQDMRGPHHRHPNGEIDLIMPLTEGAQFDGSNAGWKVYGPQSAHYPTVTNGAAHVLYLLPQGKIEFTTQHSTCSNKQ
ncbi:DUF4863 domain-containing protein [Advenella sp. S44]|uniref:DUF4863 family protein n=1 Tax=Advenella sp. S44 TaxID=1982755 RepID=UPI000C2B4779|nr:DUF4863 family protein [Advenella sp. S44]PJX25946.1 DUF4863 domain-containing protein [Advenella sp. S44]